MGNSGGAGDASGCDSWLRLSEGLIAGVHHAINNRLAALHAVGQVLEVDLSGTHPLAGALSDEIQRLKSAAGLLQLLTAGGRGEPVQVETIVADAERLFGMHHSLRDLQLDVQLEDGLYPLYIDPGALRRALAVMMAVAGRRAIESDRVVRVRVTGTPVLVELSVSATGVEDMDGFLNGLAGVEAEAAGGLLRAWGGTFEQVDAGGELLLRVSLPTLPEARRRETAAAS